MVVQTATCQACAKLVRPSRVLFGQSSFRRFAGKASSTTSSWQSPRRSSSSSSSGATAVPDRKSLYLHPTSSADVYALSFLSEPPRRTSSPTVLGICKGRALAPRHFTENPEGRRMIHEILRNVFTEDAGLQTQAATRIEGHLHVIDERNMPPPNRAGEPEDIIASVRCEDGKLVPGDYEEGSAYRIITSNGPIKLSESLTSQLVQALQVARSIEEDMEGSEQ